RNLISFPISIIRAIGTPARKIAACAEARLADFIALALFLDLRFQVGAFPVVLWISDAMPQHLLSFDDRHFGLNVFGQRSSRQCAVGRLQSSRKPTHLH